MSNIQSLRSPVHRDSVFTYPGKYGTLAAEREAIPLKYLRTVFCFILCLVLAGCASASEPVLQETITVPTIPTTIPTTPTSLPTEPPVETTQPQPEEFLLSFVGDCCLANQKGWSPKEFFIGTVGDNYAYPFASVLTYFAQDDCTFVNLESPLTDGGTPSGKQFVFKGPTAYTAILTEGSVEFANVANNHAMDYGQSGYDDTIAALSDAGILYSENGGITVFTTDSGLTIGVYAQTYPENPDAILEAIPLMREAGAELIIVCLHWGQEYYYKPNETQIAVGHAAIDAGADIVYGHHSHILQPVEFYGDGVIFYSLGNFCFGGNTNPEDKDTAILQQQVIREPDGTVRLGELIIIPCSLSSIERYNDFQPTPLDPESEAYARTLSKLNGTYGKTKLTVS